MSRFVLIHGAWHGAWCWYKVIPLLEKQGHEVIAPDLPGHGIDRTPPNRVSLKSYTDRICSILDAGGEPALLVGHSMGGIPVTQAAEYRPDRIRTLVYLTAFLLPNGMSLFDEAQTHNDSLVPPNMIFADDDPSYVNFRMEALRETFYGDCSDADNALARSLVTSQPQSPLMTPLQTTAENFGRVPRIYIEALQDKAITPPVQKKMYTNLPCQQVMSMDTSHSPFFSQPERLAGHLLSLTG
jgi:pimeloyl-ACP methyl ester carboxylesterase